MSAAGERGSLGSRIGTLAIAFAVGVVYGTIATIGHRHAFEVAGVSIPWGLVAGLVGVAALLVGIRLVAGGRAAATAAAVGVVGTVAVLSLPGPGGSVLVADGVVGMVWAIGPAIVSVLVVAWPSLPSREARRA
ncbi:histidinol dehydrogenase [Agromyces bracchium]|uniref:Histidinol dehydrogenase n=1 Tax=Agromyces bracchium TaxID=88376 RepID=A0A6I3M6G3_9MICO|nr:histidinol dehydrogenase [Agromyces bracchium]MTH68541.1 histidinol dehydrogenase [Agromyces bracchium]